MGYKIKIVFICSFSFLFYTIFLSVPIYASDYGITNKLLFSKILDNSPNIDRQSIGGNYFLVSDEDENFYVESIYGFYKYDSLGNFICATSLISGVHTFSNLIYANSKIFTVSKSWPYYFNIYSSIDCSLIDQIKLYSNNEPTPYSSISIVTDITLSTNNNYIAFFSYYLSRVYIYSLTKDELRFDQIKTSSSTPVILKEYYTKAPQNLDDSKFFAVNQQTGEILVFDYNNISTFISSFGLRGQYQNLKSLPSGSDIPFGLTKDNLITLFNKYLCIHPIANAQNMKCKEYLDLTKGESQVSTPIVSDTKDNDNSIYFFSRKNVDSSSIYFVNKYSPEISADDVNLNNKSLIVPHLRLGGLFLDGLNSVVVTSDVLRVYNKDLTELFTIELDTPVNGATYSAYYSNILGAADSDIPKILPTPSTFIPSHLFPMILYRTSAISETQKGNFYVYQEFKTNINTYVAKVYKFKGDKKRAINECPLNIYCSSTPKHRPVILIHGLGGSYKNWFDEKTGILRTTILNNFKSDDIEFPDSWIHSYSYGYNFEGDYNYQGRIEDISSNLHFDVERLSNESKAVGGDGKVDIIGYSLGGLVARHYILEKTGYPGVQNLENANHDVGKLILIASPVNGSSGKQNFDLFIQKYPFLGNVLTEKANEILSVSNGVPMDITKDVGTQLSSSSLYLEFSRTAPMPTDIAYYKSFANLLLGFKYSLFGNQLDSRVDMGDGVVFPVDTTLNVNFTKTNLTESLIGLELKITDNTLSIDSNLFEDNLNLFHTKFVNDSRNVTKVLEYLSE